jgi:hypothetical protein
MAITDRTSAQPRHRSTIALLKGAVATRDVDTGDVVDGTVIDWRGVDLQKSCRVVEDFHLAAGATLPAPWADQDTSAAGSPTTDYVSDAAGGVFRLAFDSQNEAQALTLYFGDQLVIDSTKQPFFECRLKLNTDGAALTTGEILVVGLASDRSATLDNITRNAWFRIEGANNNILAETDDGTTDDDDNDTGIDFVDNAYMVLAIDMADLSAIKFYVNGVLGATLSAAAMTGNVQPYIEIQKGVGTETHAVDIDYVHVAWMR